LVRRALSNSGIESDVFHNLEVAWQSVRSAPYSVFVVDRRLPDGDGLNLVRQLRAHGCQTPCLMLTARDALHDRIEGLESGADDYLVKPFSMEELIARVIGARAGADAEAGNHSDIDPPLCRLDCSSKLGVYDVRIRVGESRPG
jgi:DNA-binding response OmpR family regulator